MSGPFLTLRFFPNGEVKFEGEWERAPRDKDDLLRFIGSMEYVKWASIEWAHQRILETQSAERRFLEWLSQQHGTAQ